MRFININDLSAIHLLSHIGISHDVTSVFLSIRKKGIINQCCHLARLSWVSSKLAHKIIVAHPSRNFRSRLDNSIRSRNYAIHTIYTLRFSTCHWVTVLSYTRGCEYRSLSKYQSAGRVAYNDRSFQSAARNVSIH